MTSKAVITVQGELDASIVNGIREGLETLGLSVIDFRLFPADAKTTVRVNE